MFAEIKALDVTFTKWIFPFRYFYIAFNHTICFWLSDPEQFFSWSFYLSISWCKKMYRLTEQWSVERQQKRRTFTQIVTSYQAFVGHSFHRGLMVRFCLCEIPIPQEFSVWFYPRDLLTPIYKKILNLCGNSQNVKENKMMNICSSVQIERNCSAIKEIFHGGHGWCFPNEDYRTGIEASYSRNGKLQLSRHLMEVSVW